MANRKTVRARKSTGGKAPRKSLAPSAYRFSYQKAPMVEKEAEDMETQTYPSTSDAQVQASKDSADKQTQTIEAVSVIRLQKDIEAQRRQIEYMSESRTILYHRLARQAILERELVGEKTSLCNKPCCRDMA